jgi:hypothetical protein
LGNYFLGNATVVNGLFEFNFVVPRDIRIPLNNGRISFTLKKQHLIIKQDTIPLLKLEVLMKMPLKTILAQK